MFFSPKGPQDMAALVLRRRSLDSRSTTVYLDRGIRDGVDTTWSAALLDEASRPVHDWVCLEIGNDDRGQFVVPMREREIARYSRVALFQDPPALLITDESP